MAAPAHRARQALASQLRELRRSTGVTGADFAKRLGAGWAQPKVSKIETGRQLPSTADVQAWAKATDAAADELLDLLQRARVEYVSFRERGADLGGIDRLQDTIGATEATTARIASFHPVLVPAHLQTPDYTREMLLLPGDPAEPGATEGEIGRLIASRVRRQAILYEPGRDISVLLLEGALRTRVVSPPTMHAQREHIARLAETLTTATIGIVPFAAPAPVAVVNGWVIRDDVVTIETDGGDLEIADADEVERYWRNTRLILDVALTGDDAATFCRRINDEEDPAAAR